MIKFDIIVNCGIFGTYRGIGLFHPDSDAIDIAFEHGKNVLKTTTVMELEQMVQEYFIMGLNKYEQQRFNDILYHPDPDRKKELTINMYKHFSLE